MATTDHLIFHVYSESKPNNILPFLKAVSEQEIMFNSVIEMTSFAQEVGLEVPKQWNVIPQLINLIKEDNNKYFLSEVAKSIIQFNADIQVDLIHYLLYTTWQIDKPSENTRLWSYRQVVDFLWQRARVDDVSGLKNEMAEEINNQTQLVFAELPGYEAGKVSFSSKSIGGVLVWLDALTPPVIIQNCFSRRHFCAPELMGVALGWVAQQTQGELEIDFLLTPPRREMISKLCLLDLNDLDKVINWTLTKYPSLVVAGTTSGVYGRFLRFLKWPTIADLR